MNVAKTLRKQFVRRSHSGRYIGAALACGALASIAVLAWNVYRTPKQFGLSKLGRSNSVDSRRDKTLRDSFPASDPPASQYFGIPANRL